MSAFRDLMSMVDPTAAKTAPAPRTNAPGAAASNVSRAGVVLTASTHSPQLKRKASGAVESAQSKAARGENAPESTHANGTRRLDVSTSAPKPASRSIAPAVPYRGTAAPAHTRPAKVAQTVKKQAPSTSSANTVKTAPTTSASTVPVPATASQLTAAPKKGYLALLQKAKEKDQTRPVTPPVQNGQTRILTKKERLALKAGASATAKGKKAVPGPSGRLGDAKVDASKEKKKAPEVGYQGTARPAKPAAQVGYRGTARPASLPASTSRHGTPTANAKPKPPKGRYDGYADWSDLSDMEDDEEGDYESDGSSDMEGGMWDVEEEEQAALRVAKKEDAEALAEEMEHKRLKEERKRKLLAMSKAAAGKRKY